MSKTSLRARPGQRSSALILDSAISRIGIILAFVRSLLRSRRDIQLENIFLRRQLAIYKRRDAKVRLTRKDRRFLITISELWERWRSALVIVKPETILRWHRARVAQSILNEPEGGVRGAPKIAPEIAAAIVRLKKENPLWGAPRIHGELSMLGFKVSERSVSRYLKVHFPTNNRGQGWSKFLSNHRSSILSIDLFYSYTLALKRIEGLVIVDHLRRKIIHTSAARVITSDWVVQQLINAFPGECPYKYLICDNGNIFRDQFKAEVESLLGLKVMHIPKGRPWLNGICERTIGSLRRELLDHVILLNERHLGHLLAKYQSYYNSDRTHLGLGKETPNGREAMKKSGLKLISEAIFGGLHHRYRWREAA